jgi:hypothetical protein
MHNNPITAISPVSIVPKLSNVIFSEQF